MNLQWRTVSRGLLLIALGMVFLLMNMGLLPWTFWWELASWWPLILVLVGIGLLVGRRLPFSLVLFVVLVAMLVLSLTGAGAALRGPGFGPWFSGEPWAWGGWRHSGSSWGATPSRTTASRPLPEGVTSAEVTLETGGVGLTLDGSAPGLVDADLGYWGEAPEVRTGRSGDTANVRISQAKTVQVWPGRPAPSWNVHLTHQVPVDLRTRVGAIKGDLDLSQVKLQRLDVQAGAGDLRLIFGQVDAKVPVSLDVAASHVTLVVPAGVPVRIRAQNVLGGLRGLSDLSKSSDGTYSTPNFGTASIGLDVALHGAVSDLQLERD
ncbi:MAG: DUF5668 domain-containing protein [Firmicutes bacterium]|nr:DUF5668 domain-containing protein [Bacillota bacterium]